jgi:hypothetical protein
MPSRLRAAVTTAASPRDEVAFFRRAALGTSVVAVALSVLALTAWWPGEPSAGELVNVRWSLAAAVLVLVGTAADARAAGRWPRWVVMAGFLTAAVRFLLDVGRGDDGIAAVVVANAAAALTLGVLVPWWRESLAARRSQG